MTGFDLLNLIRLTLDDTLEPVKWTDDELCFLIDVVSTDISYKVPFLLDGKDSSVVIPLIDNVAEYQLDLSIFRILSAFIGNRQLNIMEYDLFHRNYPDWKTTAGSFPNYLITNYSQNMVILYPKPILSYMNLYGNSVSLYTQRYLLPKAVNNPLFLTTDINVTNPLIINCLVNGVISRAYLKDDSDTYNLERSNSFLRLYLEEVENIKNMVSKSRGTVSTNVLPGGFL